MDEVMKLCGTYRRLKDGKEIAYWGKVLDFQFEARTYPADQKPPDNVLRLPVTIRGELVRVHTSG